MKTKRILAGASAAAIATVGIFTFSTSAANANGLAAEIAQARVDLVDTVDAGLVAAMSDTFGISTEAAYDRLALEAVASELESELSTNSDFAGLWISEDGTDIHVALAGDIDRVADIDSELSTRYVDRSLADLDEIIDQLNAHADLADADETFGWFVDVTANAVVVSADSQQAATEFISSAGVDPEAVLIDTETEAFEPEHVRGGERYVAGGNICSVGFSVRQGNTPGFVTAGHCASAGTSVTSGNAAPGTFVNSIFPRQDAAFVSVSAGKTLFPHVTMHNGYSRVVHNSNEAAVGASICRSGQTTGWRCGTIQAKGLTVNYSQGPVYNMTRTTACSSGGDSGGAHISGNSAQGIHSGSSGACNNGVGDALFYPLNPVLNQWNLSLVTS
ncbi:S1 family peptidase [Natronoglycomyces albus]|uniref:S1 family peptidase n=1 Tax=Natronoglycomyces albus TaxID=2811108 RepID=A0A895XLG8_9ACTN|nr:S1 family peptidase [Natronoglycomyces albus]QSB05917.1 S1 family peptidase [Natronoglycomyces albus]